MREVNVIVADLRKEMLNFFNSVHAKKRQKVYRPLTEAFLNAVTDLRLASEQTDDPAELILAVNRNYPHTGAPGNFGYGTPIGESLKNLYWLNNELVSATAPATAASA